MSDLTSKLQDRVWVADMIRRTEEAQAANGRLLDVLREQQRSLLPGTTVHDLQPADVVWFRDQERMVVRKVRCSHAGHSFYEIEGCDGWVVTFDHDHAVLMDGNETLPLLHRIRLDLAPPDSTAPCTERCNDRFHYPPCGAAELIEWSEAAGW